MPVWGLSVRALVGVVEVLQVVLPGCLVRAGHDTYGEV